MNETNDIHRKYNEGIFTAISVGFFLVLVGTIFIITPNLFDKILDFLRSFGLLDVPHTDLTFIGPEFPFLHLTVYQAVAQFSIALAVFQIFILALRFVIPSSWEKRSETAGNFVYWTGAAILIQLFLIENTQWFVFWSTLIIIIGVSLITRAAVIAISRI